MEKQKLHLKIRECDRCKKKYKGYIILLCDCPNCFGKFMLINSIYGRNLCKKCRKEVDFPFTKRDFENLKQQKEVSKAEAFRHSNSSQD